MARRAARVWSASAPDGAGRGVSRVVFLAGEFDIETVCEIETFLRRTFGPFYGRRDLILDLSEVTFADSAFAGCIILLLRGLHGERRELVLTRPVGQVRRLIGMMGLANVVPVFDEIDDAVAALREKKSSLIPPPFAWNVSPAQATL
jgi:anti-anti-sigma factor